MHDQSASQISGRTRAAVSAMCVRALRITVLKSAGNFTRDECHDLNAEKIQRVKCFMFTKWGICCAPAIFERRRGQVGSKISGCGQLAEVAVYFATSGLPTIVLKSRKSRSSGNLANVAISAAARLCRTDTGFGGRFCANRCGPLTSQRVKCTSGPENFQSSTKKDFFNTIPTEADTNRKGRHVRWGPACDIGI
jgi:hypothetical protein